MKALVGAFSVIVQLRRRFVDSSTRHTSPPHMTCQHHLYPTIITTTARGVPCELGVKNISTITPKNISRSHKNIACLSPAVTDLGLLLMCCVWFVCARNNVVLVLIWLFLYECQINFMTHKNCPDCRLMGHTAHTAILWPSINPLYWHTGSGDISVSDHSVIYSRLCFFSLAQK